MLSLNSSYDLQLLFRDHLYQSRRQKKWSRSFCAERSGVPASTIKRFEATAEISFRQFLMLFDVLEGLSKLDVLLKEKSTPLKSIQEVLDAQ